jgi:hypothetical protein
MYVRDERIEVSQQRTSLLVFSTTIAGLAVLAIVWAVSVFLLSWYHSPKTTTSDPHSPSQRAARVTSDATSSAMECTGTRVSPGDNLSAVAASESPGTTFCIHDGKYSVGRPILLQSGDSFIGLYSDASRPVVSTDRAKEIFDGLYEVAGLPDGSPPYVADRVRIEGLRVTGAVGGERCSPECGRGIGGGKNLTVVDVRSDHNANQGIGGTQSGLLVEGSVLDYNGSEPFLDFDGHGSAAGVKSVNSMTVRNTRVYANAWTGIWCDRGCAPFTVENVTSNRNGKSGLQCELSNGPATISNSTIESNGWSESAYGHKGIVIAGIVIAAAQNLEVYGNTFGYNVGHSVEVVNDNRGPRLANVSIHDNILNGDTINGCGIAESVTCANNTPYSGLLGH